VSDADAGPPLQGVPRMEGPAEVPVDRGTKGKREGEAPVHGLGPPCRWEMQRGSVRPSCKMLTTPSFTPDDRQIKRGKGICRIEKKRVEFNSTNSNYKIMWRVEHYFRLNVDHLGMARVCFVPALTTNRNALTNKENRVIFHVCYPTQRSAGTPAGGTYTPSLCMPAALQSTH